MRNEIQCKTHTHKPVNKSLPQNTNLQNNTHAQTPVNKSLP
jgi:hypothetical protein